LIERIRRSPLAVVCGDDSSAKPMAIAGSVESKSIDEMMNFGKSAG